MHHVPRAAALLAILGAAIIILINVLGAFNGLDTPGR